ncbi:MAG: hypothetical protein AAF961_12810, partial [Planctomycetota bacterium]
MTKLSPNHTTTPSNGLSLPHAAPRRVAGILWPTVLLSTALTAAFSPAQVISGWQPPIIVSSGPDGSQVLALPPAQPGVGLPNQAAGHSKKNGLQVQVALPRNDVYGYVPVRFTLNAQPTVAADRQITIRFSAGNWQTGGRSMTTEADGQLDAGATSTTIVLLTPKYVDWQTASWDVWIDGVKDQELSLDSRRPIGFASGNGMVSVLVVGKDVSAYLGKLSLPRAGGVPRRTIAPRDLPADW